MGKGRLEAFSDGVLAIIITIMVLELKVPHGDGTRRAEAIAAGVSQLRVELYLCRHLLEQPSPHAPFHQEVNGGVLWANLHLLFWLSLFPFTTGWMGENHFAPLPSALYGCVLLMAAIAYYVLQRAIIALEGRDSLAVAIGRDWKGKLSLVLYLAGVVSTAWLPWVAQAIYVVAALFWVIPDRRIEHVLSKVNGREHR